MKAGRTKSPISINSVHEYPNEHTSNSVLTHTRARARTHTHTHIHTRCKAGCTKSLINTKINSVLDCMQISKPATFSLSLSHTHTHVPAGSPSRGGDIKVYVLDINQPSLPTPFILFLCLFFSYGPFTCISFHKFSRKLSVYSLCSPSLISASLVLSTIYFFLKASLNGCLALM